MSSNGGTSTFATLVWNVLTDSLEEEYQHGITLPEGGYLLFQPLEIHCINLHSRCSGLQPSPLEGGFEIFFCSVGGHFVQWCTYFTSSFSKSSRSWFNKALGEWWLYAMQPDYLKFSHWLTNTIWLDRNVLGMAQDSKEILLNLRAPAV